MQIYFSSAVYCKKEFEKRNLHELAAEFYDRAVWCRPVFLCVAGILHDFFDYCAALRLVVAFSCFAAFVGVFVLENVFQELRSTPKGKRCFSAYLEPGEEVVQKSESALYGSYSQILSLPCLLGYIAGAKGERKNQYSLPALRQRIC